MQALVALFLILMPAAHVSARTATDSAGRRVEVPDRIEKVFAAGPPASILLYILAPEKMMGWPDPPRGEERPFIAPANRDLPALGRLTGRGGTANLEVVLKTKPDLILDFSSVRDTYVSLADNVQQQTGIPYILIDGRFGATAAALRLLGDILGHKDRGELIAKYVESTFAEIDAVLKTTPGDKRPRVYLAALLGTALLLTNRVIPAMFLLAAVWCRIRHLERSEFAPSLAGRERRTTLANVRAGPDHME